MQFPIHILHPQISISTSQSLYHIFVHEFISSAAGISLMMGEERRMKYHQGNRETSHEFPIPPIPLPFKAEMFLYFLDISPMIFPIQSRDEETLLISLEKIEKTLYYIVRCNILTQLKVERRRAAPGEYSNYYPSM